MQNDVINELGQNFIEYAVAVNTDRAIPNANDGLKPVAKRIIYGAYDQGFKSDKTHVKCANIVGKVMADWHPHGDSSIYGALVRLSQSWVMRYPLIDFHGSNGNIDGDGPAAARYTEAKLSKLVEDGMLANIKKNSVDYMPNYSEDKDEPIELPSIFPNLLCNPNSGIGVAIACNWAPHNLKEVAQAIKDYIDGKEPSLPGPDFPTGGIIINKNDIPAIMKTGRGSVKIRGKYTIEKNSIVFTEIPYGVGTEELMTQIGELCDKGDISDIEDIRNESNKKGFRLVIECDKRADINKIVNKLFAKTDLQTSFAYNQVALVNKTPTELNLKDCIKIYVDYNSNCIVRECQFDITKAENRLHIIIGLLKALDIIDDIIAMIKLSSSASTAKETLINQWEFSDVQAQAILDMKLSKLAKLEKEDLETEKKELQDLIIQLTEICEHPIPELYSRLEVLVSKYGDDRRTELAQIDVPKAEKEIVNVEPEKVVVVMTEQGSIKRVPATSFRAQNRNTKGVKTQDDITKAVIRTNTIDQLLLFTNQGTMYKLLVDDIPVGNNTSRGVNISTLITMAPGEEVQVIYSMYYNTDAKYVLFTTKNGLIKKTTLEEYINTRKKNGMSAINIKEGDAIANVNLIKEEEIMLITHNGYAIHLKSTDFGASGRNTMGIKGMNVAADDYIVSTLVIRNNTDDLAVFYEFGQGKKIKLKDFAIQNRGGKGLLCCKVSDSTGHVVSATLVSDEDIILIVGSKTSLCIQATDIPACARLAIGNILIKDSKVVSVSKV